MINTIVNGNCREVFPEIRDAYLISLVLSDPPYNINFKGYEDYDRNGYQDNLTEEEYVELLSTFNGTDAAIIHYPEEMMKYVVPAMGVPDEVLAWCYPSNIGRKFRLVNIYGKKSKFERVLQPYRNPNDKRVQSQIAKGSKGTPMYDWFTDINIVKNVSKEKTAHPCPVPSELMKRLIILLTEPGDLVVDPFMGSGTTAIACLETNRNYIGIELSKKYYDIANKRIEDYKERHKDIFK